MKRISAVTVVDLVIDAEILFIRVVQPALERSPVPAGRIDEVRRRIHFCVSGGIGIDARGRNDVARERLSRIRVVDRTAERREVSGSKGGCRQQLREALLPALLDKSEQNEEECLVLTVVYLGDVNRPAYRAATIIANKRIAHRRKEIPRVELVVSVERIERPVQVVGAALRDHIELRAASGAELGGIVAANGP